MKKCLAWSKYATSSAGGYSRTRPKYEYEAKAGGTHYRVVPRSDVSVRRAYQLQVARGTGRFAIKGEFRTPQEAKAHASRLECKKRG